MRDYLLICRDIVSAPPVYPGQTGPPQAATYPSMMFPTQTIYMPQQYPLPMPVSELNFALLIGCANNVPCYKHVIRDLQNFCQRASPCCALK